MGPKRLQLLRELVPHAGVIAFVVSPTSAAALLQAREVKSSAEAVGQQIVIVEIAAENQIEEAFATLSQRRVGAILYSANLFFQVHRDKLVALAARYAIPAMYEWRELVEAGGLISYSAVRADSLRQMGIYVGRVLKGEKPADLPIVQSSKFELIINLKTAKAL